MPAHIQPQPNSLLFSHPFIITTGWLKASCVKSWSGCVDIALYLCASVDFSAWTMVILFSQFITDLDPFSHQHPIHQRTPPAVFRWQCLLAVLQFFSLLRSRHRHPTASTSASSASSVQQPEEFFTAELSSGFHFTKTKRWGPSSQWGSWTVRPLVPMVYPDSLPGSLCSGLRLLNLLLLPYPPCFLKSSLESHLVWSLIELPLNQFSPYADVSKLLPCLLFLSPTYGWSNVSFFSFPAEAAKETKGLFFLFC